MSNEGPLRPALVADDESSAEGAPSKNVHQPSVRTQQKPDVSAAAAAALAACEWDEWGERETWALEDSVPRFSLEGGRIVLWRRMSLEVPELLQFTPAQLHARWLVQGGPAAAALLRNFEPPPCLEDWTCTAPHRYEGALHNVPSMRDGTLRATVEHDVEAELILLEEGDDAGAALGCSPEGLMGSGGGYARGKAPLRARQAMLGGPGRCGRRCGASRRRGGDGIHRLRRRVGETRGRRRRDGRHRDASGTRGWRLPCRLCCGVVLYRPSPRRCVRLHRLTNATRSRAHRSSGPPPVWVGRDCARASKGARRVRAISAQTRQHGMHVRVLI